MSSYLILSYFGHGDASSHLHAMGFWPLGIKETASTLLLTATLFAGPLYETLLLDGAWKEWTSLRALSSTWSSLITWRNIVIVSLLHYPFHL